MIALDTNILVHARREESEHHVQARALLESLSMGFEPWAIPWPCVYEFFRVVTHPNIFTPPSEPSRVLEDLEDLLASPSLTLLGPGPRHLSHLLRVFESGSVRGNAVFDAHIATLVAEHGVREIWTLDRDFRRLGSVRAVNPFDEPDRVREPRRRYRVRRSAPASI